MAPAGAASAAPGRRSPPSARWAAALLLIALLEGPQHAECLVGVSGISQLATDPNADGMNGTWMLESMLPVESKHDNYETATADWLSEYPVHAVVQEEAPPATTEAPKNGWLG